MSQTPSKLILTIIDDNAVPERLDEITTTIIQDLRIMGVGSIDRPRDQIVTSGAKGDPITVGAIALAGISVALPSIISFLQNWLIEGRKILLESPNGAKIEFTPERKYSETEILTLVEKLNEIDSQESANS